jgi:hypothetical protein
MDAPFHPYTDSPSHKGGGSILFLTTDLRRIQTNHTSQEDQITKDIDHVAIRIDHGEVVGRGPNPQELLALLGALAVSTRLTTPHLTDKRIGSDCKSLVDYINEYRHARMRNEVRKLPFLLAIQQYLQETKPSRFDGSDRILSVERRTKWSMIWTSGGYTSQIVMRLTKNGQMDYMGRISRLLWNS